MFPTSVGANFPEHSSQFPCLVNNHRVTNRTLIVEDDNFTRMLLRGQLEALGYHVIGDADSANGGMDIARLEKPDIALLDLDLGRGPTGIDLAYGLRGLLPTIAIVLLTSYADIRLIGTHRHLPPGSIYLVKRSLEEPQQLAAAIRTALGSGPYVPSAPLSNVPRLSDGQAEILRLVANGFSNAEISRRRHLSESAVIKAVGRLVEQLHLAPSPGDNQRVLLTQAYFQLTGTHGERRD